MGKINKVYIKFNLNQNNMKKAGEIISTIVMAIGLIQGLYMTELAASAVQYTQAAIPIVGGYVLGRAIENLTK